MINPKRKIFKISELIGANYNPRKITDNQKAGLSASIEKFGYVQDIIVNIRDNKNVIVGGHKRLEVLNLQSDEEIECTVVDLSEIEEKALNIALNNKHISGEYEIDGLKDILKELKLDFNEFGDFNFDDLADEFKINLDDEIGIIDKDNDIIPEVSGKISIKRGDLIELGEHRLLCGDSTNSEDVKKLMRDAKSILLHSDPPYGMGKEKDGVQNDNLYREKLDTFQMKWIKVFFKYLADNASVYIWGNPEGIWRLWWTGGLKDYDNLTFKNEIVWDKGPGMGIKSEYQRKYTISTERCFFLMRGKQDISTNADNYFVGWEPVRTYLCNEIDKLKEIKGWSLNDIGEKLGVSGRMVGHWITRSQWCFIPENHYIALQELSKTETNNILKKSFSVFQKEYKNILKTDYCKTRDEFYETRAYFDNTHEAMTEVFRVNRVHGEDRLGHATPKPVELITKLIKSSSPKNKIIIEPFLGSGTTLIAAEMTDRICYGVEIDEKYCQVIVQRWCDYTKSNEVKLNGEIISWD